MTNVFNNATNTNNIQTNNVPPIIVEIDDLCKLLNIGKNTAYKLLTSNQIESFKVGSVWKIPMYAINEYIRMQCSKPKRYLYKLIDKDRDLKYEQALEKLLDK